MAGTATRWHEKKTRLPVEPFVPVDKNVPSISGTGTVGQVLTASNGDVTGDPDPTFTYQWLRGGADISGATASTYTLVAGDSGNTVTCRVTATNVQGTTVWVTNGIAVT